MKEMLISLCQFSFNNELRHFEIIRCVLGARFKIKFVCILILIFKNEESGNMSAERYMCLESGVKVNQQICQC